jgi:hypothetical protein
VHPTWGTRRVFERFLGFGGIPFRWRLHPPTHQRVTPAVETVEKVPFRKLIFGKWDKNIEKRLVFCVQDNILVIFEPVVGDFCEDFSSKEFFDSLVGWQKSPLVISILFRKLNVSRILKVGFIIVPKVKR